MDILHLKAATQRATGPMHQFSWSQWRPHSANYLIAGATLVAILLLGEAVLFLFRKLLKRYHVAGALQTGLVVVAINAALWALVPDPMSDMRDSLTLYIRDVFVFALLLVALRLADRLVLVSILTRGGRFPLPRFIHQVIIVFVYLFAFLLYVSWAFDIDIDKFLAGSAVISIILGLALQETLGNFLSGMVMQASSPFAIGHWINCSGAEGRVVDMTWRSVTLHTLDDNYVLLPNSVIAKEKIVNFNHPTQATARIVETGVEYGSPPVEVCEVLRKAALETPGVLPKPEPVVFVSNFASYYVAYSVKFWIDDAWRHIAIESAVRTNIWYRLKHAEFDMPSPIRQVELSSADRKAARQKEADVASRRATIDKTDLFAKLAPEQRLTLAREAGFVLLAPLQVLYRQNDLGDNMYIIQRGTLEVLIDQGDGKPALRAGELQTGTIFGEVGALTGEPRGATVRAVTETACIEITREDLQKLIDLDPQIMETLAAMVANRKTRREEILKDTQGHEIRQNSPEGHRTLLGRMRRLFGAK